MPGFARKEIVREGEVGVYHCVARCVRRAFLCGVDPYSGADYSHRKVLVQKRLRFLAEVFGVDLGGYAVMSNHLHVVVRTRPDAVEKWSDEDVARRWWRLFPKRLDKRGNPAEPTPAELNLLMNSEQAMAEKRKRLSSLSWFMRCVCEYIARRANREDQCTGRFWEGRFKSQALLDDAAVLACCVYVDLNPVRAGIAKTPEGSRFTSVRDRIKSRQHSSGKKSPKKKSPAGRKRKHPPEPSPASWLSPLVAEETSRSRSASKAGCSPEHRASSDSFFDIDEDDYLKLVDWTGRQVRGDKPGAIPSHLAPILERLQVNDETWAESVKTFGVHFHRAAGRAASTMQAAEKAGRRWFRGVGFARSAFG